MSEITDVLDQLNRDLVNEYTRRRNAAIEAYPGIPGEADIPAGEYDDRMATCRYEMDVAAGIEIAREYVLKERELAAQADTSVSGYHVNGPALDPPERWETCAIHGYDADTCPCNDRAADEAAYLRQWRADVAAGLVGFDVEDTYVGFERVLHGEAR